MAAFKSRQGGFALAGAVLAMLIVGAIVTGGFYAANQQSAVVRSEYLGDLAQKIAESGLDATTGRTRARALDSMAMNTIMPVFTNQSVSYGGRVVGTFSTTVTRTTSMLFIVRSTGTVTIGGANAGATRTVGSIVRLRIADFDNQTALQIFGDLEVSGTARVSGTDVNLSAWSGSSCTTTSGTSAVTAQPGATIQTNGNGTIAGTTTRQVMDTSAFTVFGDMTWADVVALKTLEYPAGQNLTQIDPVCNPSSCLPGGTCTTSSNRNWGAPTSATNPCFDHFPIIHALGNLSIASNGRGQGILLVEGNLNITGQFEFYGPVIVRGIIDVGAGGSNIYGSVFAFGGGVIGTDNNIAGGMVLEYSSCSIKRAVLGATGLSRGIPIRNRSWIDLTTAQNSY